MKPLRIAYFTHDSIAEGVGRSQILALCKSLSEFGIDVNLFSFEKNVINQELRTLTSTKGLKWTPYNFSTIPYLSSLDRINTLRRVDGEFDLIHARGDLPALSAVLRKNEPVLWDIRSLWAEQRQVLNPRKFNRLTISSLNQITRFISRRVSGYNTLTHSILPYLEDLLPQLPRFHVNVSTCVNTDFFTYRNVLPEKPQALLSGTYNKIYDEFLINRFNSYMRSNFQHEVLWARGREAGFKTQDLGQTKSDTFTYDEMPSIVAASSYGIAVCKNYLGPSLYAAMPTKIAEFLSVGRPVVVNSNLGDVQTRLLDQGVAISLNNVADIPKAAKNLIDLLDDPKTPERCRRIAVKYFSLETATKTYAEIYRSISNSFQG